MLSKCVLASLMVAPVCAFGQAGTPQSSHEIPVLRSADVPTYPPIAEAARITGKVTVRVHVIAGRVIREEILRAEVMERRRALASRTYPLLTTSIIENLKTWKFDKSVNDQFVVHYIYGITGTATDNPTNPSVEISPTLDVTITARPVKPTVNY